MWVARHLERLGAEYLAVACVWTRGRSSGPPGVKIPILILGDTPAERSGDLLDLNLAQTVPDVETAKLSAAAVAAGKTLKIHIKADTGMSRLGFRATRPIWRTPLPGWPGPAPCRPGPRGIFTRFADSDGSEEYTMLQFTRFLAAVEQLAGGA